MLVSKASCQRLSRTDWSLWVHKWVQNRSIPTNPVGLTTHVVTVGSDFMAVLGHLAEQGLDINDPLDALTTTQVVGDVRCRVHELRPMAAAERLF